MTASRRLYALATLALFAAVPVCAQEGQPRPSAECSDDRGADRCDPALQAKVRAAFGVASAEAFDREGAQMLRSFFVDGYGNDQPLVTFVRRRGGEPELLVTNPPIDKTSFEMRATVPLAIWERLMRRARFFDRALVPPTKKSGAFNICLHSWVVTVESTGLATEQKGARRKTQDACDDGLAVALAFEMADAAVEMLPACGLLLADQYRNAIMRLRACGTLEGDRAAAALASNRYRINAFANPYAAEGGASIAYLFHEQAEIVWPGDLPVRGMKPASEAWAARKLQHRIFQPLRFIGDRPDSVRVEGRAMEEASSDHPNGRSASAVQVWTRENGSDFRLRRMTVEPLVPNPPK